MKLASPALTALTLVALSACGPTTSFPAAATATLSSTAARSTGRLPSELLYVAGGPLRTRHPSIRVYDVNDKSKDPQPIYSIPPRAGGEYEALAVDSENNLYVINGFANGDELDVFPSGKEAPSVACLLANRTDYVSIAGNVLYVATRNYNIQEYDLPLHAAKNCAKPNETLVDARAKLRGRYFLAVAADSQGDIFDTWLSDEGADGVYIDEFTKGSKQAHPYAPLGQDAGYSLISDDNKNLITDVAARQGGDHGSSIGILRYGSKEPDRHRSIRQGVYSGFAFAGNETQLLACRDYPSTAVVLFAYDPASAQLGKRQRTFSAGIWRDAGSIAVFSRR